MTEVEFTRLMSELAQTAPVLNKESDSINHLIEEFQDSLGKLNLGLEVWLSRPIRTQATSVEWSNDWAPATTVIRLGFGRDGTERTWELRVRHVTYRDTNEDTWGPQVGGHYDESLLKASRDVRIAALRAFPELLKELKSSADAAIATIQQAKKFVQ